MLNYITKQHTELHIQPFPGEAPCIVYLKAQREQFRENHELSRHFPLLNGYNYYQRIPLTRKHIAINNAKRLLPNAHHKIKEQLPNNYTLLHSNIVLL